jgi:GTP-binding protein
MADIPGLIQGAHRGAGLGFEFLKHIERTTIIAHIIDIMPLDGSDPVDNYKAVRNELHQYSRILAQKREIIVANKTDLDSDGKGLTRLREGLDKDVYPISAVTGAGVRELAELLWRNIKQDKDSPAQKI